MNHCITIFGSSSPKPGEEEYQTAYQLGRELARSGFTLCNGGYGGTMEASARGASETNGHTIGVICEQFGNTANSFIRETITTKTHSERLHKLIELGNAYVILKGSTGTLVELALVWEYMNKGIMKEKPIIILGNFWKPAVDTLKGELMFEGKEQATKYVTLAKNIFHCIELLKKGISVTSQA